MVDLISEPSLHRCEENDTPLDIGQGTFGNYVAKRVREKIRGEQVSSLPSWITWLRDVFSLEPKPEHYHIVVGAAASDWQTGFRELFGVSDDRRGLECRGYRLVLLPSIDYLSEHLKYIRRTKKYTGIVHIWIAVAVGYRLLWPLPPAGFHCGGGMVFHGFSNLVTIVSKQPRESAAQEIHDMKYEELASPMEHTLSEEQTPPLRRHDSGYFSDEVSTPRSRSRGRRSQSRQQPSAAHGVRFETSSNPSQDSRANKDDNGVSGTKAHSTNKPKQTTRSTTEIWVQAIGSNVNINSDAKMEPYVKQMNSDSPTIGNDQTSGNNLGSESDGSEYHSADEH